MPFPITPNIGDTFIVGNIDYKWTGYAWDAVAKVDVVPTLNYEHVALSGQTVFSAAGYRDKSYITVKINGLTLDPALYSADDKLTVVLVTGATVGDTVAIEILDPATVLEAYSLPANTTPVIDYADGTLRFGIPQGIQGVQGVKGDTGATAVTVARFVTTKVQDTFSTNYTIGNILVYLNGVKLTDEDFVATDGFSVVLAVPVEIGSVVEIIKYSEMVPNASYTTAEIDAFLATKANLGLNTYSGPQRTTITSTTNDIDFRLANNFTINAAAANITATSLVGCTGQSGVIVIHAAENVTGWSTEFKFKIIPMNLVGTEVFSYFIHTATDIFIGRVA